MRLLPRQNRVEIWVFFIRIEVRERLELLIHPEARVYIYIAAAHDILKQCVEAVPHVQIRKPIGCVLSP